MTGMLGEVSGATWKRGLYFGRSRSKIPADSDVAELDRSYSRHNCYAANGRSAKLASACFITLSKNGSKSSALTFFYRRTQSSDRAKRNEIHERLKKLRLTSAYLSRAACCMSVRTQSRLSGRSRTGFRTTERRGGFSARPSCKANKGFGWRGRS
jgi:hypothetical protein